MASIQEAQKAQVTKIKVQEAKKIDIAKKVAVAAVKKAKATGSLTDAKKAKVAIQKVQTTKLTAGKKVADAVKKLQGPKKVMSTSGGKAQAQAKAKAKAKAAGAKTKTAPVPTTRRAVDNRTVAGRITANATAQFKALLELATSVRASRSKPDATRLKAMALGLRKVAVPAAMATAAAQWIAAAMQLAQEVINETAVQTPVASAGSVTQKMANEAAKTAGTGSVGPAGESNMATQAQALQYLKNQFAILRALTATVRSSGDQAKAQQLRNMVQRLQGLTVLPQYQAVALPLRQAAARQLAAAVQAANAVLNGAGSGYYTVPTDAAAIQQAKVLIERLTQGVRTLQATRDPGLAQQIRDGIVALGAKLETPAVSAYLQAHPVTARKIIAGMTYANKLVGEVLNIPVLGAGGSAGGGNEYWSSGEDDPTDYSSDSDYNYTADDADYDEYSSSSSSSGGGYYSGDSGYYSSDDSGYTSVDDNELDIDGSLNFMTNDAPATAIDPTLFEDDEEGGVIGTVKAHPVLFGLGALGIGYAAWRKWGKGKG